MFREHKNCLFQNEMFFVLDENSVERKSCISRESNIPDLTIYLNSCYDEHEATSSCNATIYLSYYTGQLRYNCGPVRVRVRIRVSIRGPTLLPLIC